MLRTLGGGGGGEEGNVNSCIAYATTTPPPAVVCELCWYAKAYKLGELNKPHLSAWLQLPQLRFLPSLAINA